MTREDQLKSLPNLRDAISSTHKFQYQFRSPFKFSNARSPTFKIHTFSWVFQPASKWRFPRKKDSIANRIDRLQGLSSQKGRGEGVPNAIHFNFKTFQLIVTQFTPILSIILKTETCKTRAASHLKQKIKQKREGGRHRRNGSVAKFCYNG